VLLRHLNKPQTRSRFNLVYSDHKSRGKRGAGSSNWLTACKFSPDGSVIAFARPVPTTLSRPVDMGEVNITAEAPAPLGVRRLSSRFVAM
jgi:hypothetical protein